MPDKYDRMLEIEEQETTKLGLDEAKLRGTRNVERRKNRVQISSPFVTKIIEIVGNKSIRSNLNALTRYIF